MTRIPNFIKSVCLDYGQNSITEDEFINCMQYLITNGIIVLPPQTSTISAPTPSTTETIATHVQTVNVNDSVPMKDA